jgi:hypothetical protein
MASCQADGEGRSAQHHREDVGIDPNAETALASVLYSINEELFPFRLWCRGRADFGIC